MVTYSVVLVTTDKIAVALRVLTAIHENREPDERDVMLLRGICAQSERDLDPGEIACFVILRALKVKKRSSKPKTP